MGSRFPDSSVVRDNTRVGVCWCLFCFFPPPSSLLLDSTQVAVTTTTSETERQERDLFFPPSGIRCRIFWQDSTLLRLTDVSHNITFLCLLLSLSTVVALPILPFLLACCSLSPLLWLLASCRVTLRIGILDSISNCVALLD